MNVREVGEAVAALEVVLAPTVRLAKVDVQRFGDDLVEGRGFVSVVVTTLVARVLQLNLQIGA